MPQNNDSQAKNSRYIRWEVPEYRAPQRDRNWYLIAGAFAFICLFFSFFTVKSWHLVFLGLSSNFLFVLILLIAAIIMIINESRPPLMIKVELGPEGIKLGPKFYDYNQLKNFAVLYKPKQSVKNLYFEYKKSASQRLSLPLRRLDPLTVRNFLVRYLDEDLERTDLPLSEQLTKLLKL
jgi:hypothetical protein